MSTQQDSAVHKLMWTQVGLVVFSKMSIDTSKHMPPKLWKAVRDRRGRCHQSTRCTWQSIGCKRPFIAWVPTRTVSGWQDHDTSLLPSKHLQTVRLPYRYRWYWWLCRCGTTWLQDLQGVTSSDLSRLPGFATVDPVTALVSCHARERNCASTVYRAREAPLTPTHVNKFMEKTGLPLWQNTLLAI